MEFIMSLIYESSRVFVAVTSALAGKARKMESLGLHQVRPWGLACKKQTLVKVTDGDKFSTSLQFLRTYFSYCKKCDKELKHRKSYCRIAERICANFDLQAILIKLTFSELV